MTRISIQGRTVLPRKIHILQIELNYLRRNDMISKNKPGNRKHYYTMAWKHIYREYRVQHRETFIVWERLASFVILFSPRFCRSIRNTRKADSTCNGSTQPKTLGPQHCYWWNMQWCFRHSFHSQWNTQLNERKSLAF